MKSYIWLALAITLEVCGSTFLKLSQGFTVLLPSIGVVIGFVSSFTFLGIALNGIPLSVAYAIWSGAGTALTALMGILLFDEAISWLKTVAILSIIMGVVVLNRSRSVNTGDQSKQTQKSFDPR